MTTKNKRRLNNKIDIRLPPYQYQKLLELSTEHNVSLSATVRALLKKVLDEIIDEQGYERKG